MDNYYPMWGHPITDWYRWFAWRPVRTEDRGWRWLRFVWKRKCQKNSYLYGPIYQWYQHVVTR